MESPISWQAVHTYVRRLLAGQPTTVIVCGTPEWRALRDDDPQKLAALLTAASRWALEQELLHLDHRRAAGKDAAIAIASAKDWAAVARQLRDRDDFYNTNPDLRRIA